MPESQKRNEKLNHIVTNYINGNLSYAGVKIRSMRKVELAYLLINVEEFMPEFGVDRLNKFIMDALNNEL